MVYDVLIIGAGHIASGFDSLDSAEVLTHAHAVEKHPDFNLLGFYDTDIKKAENAAAKWSVNAYKSPVKADIIVICSSDNSHLDNIIQAVNLNPKLIILEKPIADNVESAEKIIEITKGIPVQVNFSRRFVPEFQYLKSEIKNYGKFLSGTGLYGKGLIHNGSHMIDLLRMLLGEIKNIEVIDEIYDCFPNDSTKTVILNITDGNFFMRGIDCRYYTIFEFDFCFEKARVRVINGGEKILIDELKPSEKFSGYTNLALKEEINTKIDNAMYNLYQNVFDFLTNGAELISPIEKAFTKVIYTK